MGCNCSREDARVIVSKQFKNKHIFIIKIHIPNSDTIKVIKHEEKSDYMVLNELINDSLFCGEMAEELDANFISFYDNQKDEFEYYIERLFGFQIEKEDDPLQGKIWVPYINQEKFNWSYLCGNCRVVKKDDNIELKYEVYEED